MALTPEQRAAVEAAGGPLMLSAAAGSGKTSVLTKRAVHLILERGVEADRLLIVTFTRAAAAEMKGRIVRELSDYVAAHPQDARARQQRAKLDRARIGTIDSLCSAILREYFQAVGLPPSFRILDEGSELETMKEDAASAVIEAAYAADPPEFRELAELLSDSRGDHLLAETVLEVIKFARAHPHYRRWLREKLALYRDFKSPAQSLWAQLLFARAQAVCETQCEALAAAVREAADPWYEGYRESIENDYSAFEAMRACVRARDWDGCFAAAEGYHQISLGKNIKSGHANARIKAARESAKKRMDEFKKLFCANEEDFSQDVCDLEKKIDCLCALALDTDERLQRAKLEAGVLDFDDLNQMTCALLTDETGAPTQAAAELSARWDEVMVDESQDVSEVQSRLLSALALRGNFFCVGDVKQSIYRFRMAEPKLFLERIRSAHPFDGAHFPAVIYLNRNFRTAPDVTGVINETFDALMTPGAGDLRYDETQRLIPREDFPQGVERGVDLCLLKKESVPVEGGETLSAEPAFVAAEIRRLLDSGACVTEGDTVRPVRPSDIAILMQSVKNGRGERYLRALRAVGIEAALKGEEGLLSAPETAAVLNVLSAIANPMRDVELLGAMVSPLFGFTDDELAAIRAAAGKCPLYEAVCAAAERDAHAAQFLEALGEFRRLSLMLPPDELIGELLRRTGFDVYCRGLKNNGAHRLANLILLQQYAAESGAGAVATLEGFLRRIDRIRRRKKDLAPAAQGEGAEAVSILTIHKAKGLEWPIVFVSELGASPQEKELKAKTILHPEHGFACVRRDRQTRREFLTVPLTVLRAEEKSALRSEGLRKLYVAMTRAKDRLYLTAAVANPQKTLHDNDCGGLQTPLDPVLVREKNSFLAWILSALSVRRDLSALAEGSERSDGLRVRLPETPELLRAETACPAEAPADEEAARALCARILRPYAHEKAAALPSKLSVSELSHGPQSRFFTGVPAFVSGGRLTGAARGTAIHAFLQSCDLAAAARDPAAEAARLRAGGFLTREQAEAIDLRQIETFFAGALGRRILAADRVLREYPMLGPASASPLTAQYVLPDGEAAMLQGVADCILIEGDRAVLIDYKTDRVQAPGELLERYRTQLLLYRDLLALSLSVPVTECFLYSFALGREIPLSAEE